MQDVLYTICNNCGPVQRIVIFRKNGVQAMVEYPFWWVQNLGVWLLTWKQDSFLVVDLDNLVFSGLFLNSLFTFDSVQSAQRAKASLNGADIYSGCCTLKIEYAKVTV